MNKDIIIRAESLSKTYKSGAKHVKAVDGVTLEVKSGKSLVVVGPSGAGKSTLLHMFGGLDRPTRGKVFFRGEDLYSLPDRRRARLRAAHIGFVFQFYHLLPEFTALENVMLPMMIRGRSRDEDVSRCGIRRRATEMLRIVGLNDRALHRPGELSGGQTQRVAIARALVNGPEVLLCDEPTGNLDSENRGIIYSLLADIAKKGTAVVIVTHDKDIGMIPHETVYLKDGRIE